MVGLSFRQRSQEAVDGTMFAAYFRARTELQQTVAINHVPVRRDNVDVVRLYRLVVLGLERGHRGGAREQFAEKAAAAGIQVLDNDEGHAGVRRQGGHQLLQGLKAAS